MFWGIGLDGWTGIVVVLIGLSGAFVVASGLSTWIAYDLQRQEAKDASEALLRYQTSSDVKISDAEARALEAMRDLEKFRAGRSVTPEQHEVLVRWLKISPKGRVIVKPNFLNSEATRFASGIDAAFNGSGFSGVGDAPINILAYNRPGLFLAVKDSAHAPPHTDPILKAFAEAKIPIESGYGAWVPDDDTVVILVSEQP